MCSRIFLILALSIISTSYYSNVLESMNVKNSQLELCSNAPMTGYYRDGYCNTGDNDYGTHVVCAQVTDEFLEFTKGKGNDLSTPRGSFPGLKDGDNWCLCALRWMEAYNTNNQSLIPKLNLNATHVKMLDYTDINTLKAYQANP